MIIILQLSSNTHLICSIGNRKIKIEASKTNQEFWQHDMLYSSKSICSALNCAKLLKYVVFALKRAAMPLKLSVNIITLLSIINVSIQTSCN